MKVVIGNDHAGVDLKNSIIKFLEKKGFDVVNVGTDTTDSVDYPDIAKKCCQEYKSSGADFGILICGTGIGISIAANKVNGIRAALLNNNFSAKMAKEHNNANFICFGAKIDYSDSVESMIDSYLNASFEGGRHNKRLDKLNTMN